MRHFAGWLVGGSSCTALLRDGSKEEFESLPVSVDDEGGTLVYITSPLLSLREREQTLDLLHLSKRRISCIRSSAALLALALVESDEGARHLLRERFGEVTVLVVEAARGYFSASFVRVSAAADAFYCAADMGGSVSMTVRAECASARLVTDSSCIRVSDALSLLDECCERQALLISREHLRCPALLRNSGDDRIPDRGSAPDIVLLWDADDSLAFPLLRESSLRFPDASIAEAPAGSSALLKGISAAKGSAHEPCNIHIYGSVHEFCIGLALSVDDSAPGEKDEVAWVIGSCCCKNCSYSNAAEVLLIHRADDMSLVDAFLVPVREFDFSDEATLQKFCSSQEPIHTYRLPLKRVQVAVRIVQHIPSQDFAETAADVGLLATDHPLLVSVDCRSGALAVVAVRMFNFRRVAYRRMLRDVFAAVLPLVLQTSLFFACAAGVAYMYDVSWFRKGALRIAE